MRKLLGLLIGLLFSSSLFAQAYVDDDAGTWLSGTTATATIAGVTAGNQLIAACMERDGSDLAGPPAISDNQSNTWVSIGSQCQNVDAVCITVWWAASAAATASTTITCTLDAEPTTYVAAQLYEISGFTLVDPAASNPAGAEFSGSSTQDPGNITTSEDNAMIITWSAFTNAASETAGTNYTLGSTSARTASQYDVDVGSAGSIATAMTTADNETGATFAVAFAQSCTPTKLALHPLHTQLANEYEDRTFDLIKVLVQNSADATCTTATNSIAVAKGDTGAGTLSGTTPVSAVAGVATFNDLSWDTEESITLDWTSSGLTGIDEQATVILDVPAGDYIDLRDNGPEAIGATIYKGLDFAPTDLDIRADIKLADWTPASDTVVVAQEDAWAVYVTTEGYLAAAVSTDGSTWLTCESDAAPSSPTRLSIRVQVDVDNGSSGWDCSFSTKTSESITNHVGWTALGTDPITTATATSINDSQQLITIGTDHEGTYADLATGDTVYQVAIHESIDGPNLADLDLRDDDQQLTSTTWADSSDNLWTLNGSVSWSDGSSSTILQHPVHPTHPRYRGFFDEKVLWKIDSIDSYTINCSCSLSSCWCSAISLVELHEWLRPNLLPRRSMITLLSTLTAPRALSPYPPLNSMFTRP